MGVRPRQGGPRQWRKPGLLSRPQAPWILGAPGHFLPLTPEVASAGFLGGQALMSPFQTCSLSWVGAGEAVGVAHGSHTGDSSAADQLCDPWAHPGPRLQSGKTSVARRLCPQAQREGSAQGWHAVGLVSGSCCH